jgi:hypothetical protein
MKKLLIPVILSALVVFGGYAMNKLSGCNCPVKCACAPCGCGK